MSRDKILKGLVLFLVVATLVAEGYSLWCFSLLTSYGVGVGGMFSTMFLASFVDVSKSEYLGEDNVTYALAIPWFWPIYVLLMVIMVIAMIASYLLEKIPKICEILESWITTGVECVLNKADILFQKYVEPPFRKVAKKLIRIIS